MSQTPAAPQITGKMFLFERPELLNKEQHSDFGLARAEKPFAFCAKVRAIPLMINEFPFAMRNFPIIYTDKENPTPLAVVGVIDDVNLFVDEKGQWEEFAYVPAYIRRYPFAMATETGGDRLAVVMDAASAWVAPGGEVPLFENGEPTEAMNNAIEFCKRCEGDRRLTEQMMARLKEYDLVRGQSAQYSLTEEGEGRTFAQYFGVDEQRLNELPPERFEELRKTGLLPYLYAQLMSFTNWRELMNRRAKRFNLTEDAIFEPRGLN